MSSKWVILTCLAAAITGGMLYTTLTASRGRQIYSRELQEEFARWKQTYGKLYASPAENDFRLSVFIKELSFIERKNKEYEAAIAAKGEKLSGPMFQMNALGDLTAEEFRAMYTGLSPLDKESIQVTTNTSFKVPDSKSPRPGLGQLARFIPKIRHQGSCGSCWAFSSVIELERIVYRTYGQYVDLSQQELLDCVLSSNGCSGGFAEYAFDYARAMGLRAASNYPYYGTKTYCLLHKEPGYPFNNLAIQTRFVNYNRALSEHASYYEVMPVVLVYADGVFRYLSKTADVFDVSLSGECGKIVTHAVSQWQSSDGLVTITNSWGYDWAYGGHKTLKPCNDYNLWGFEGRIAVPYDL